MSTPDEYTDNFKSNLICIFPSVRAKLKKPLCPRTQCTMSNYSEPLGVLLSIDVVVSVRGQFNEAMMSVDK